MPSKPSWQSSASTQEPLIHSKATVGGGAAHQGKDVKPFSYLTDEEFEWLTVELLTRLDECADGVSELRRRRAADYRQRPRRCAASTAERRSDAPSLRYRCSWCL